MACFLGEERGESSFIEREREGEGKNEGGRTKEGGESFNHRRKQERGGGEGKGSERRKMIGKQSVVSGDLF